MTGIINIFFSKKVIYSFDNNLYASELGNKMEAQREATFRLYYTNNTQFIRIRLIGLVI